MTNEVNDHSIIAGKIICITGGNGFIGKKLIDELAKKNCELRILTRKKNSHFPKGADIFIGDLTDPELSLKNFITGCDVLFHCAGEIRSPRLMSLLHIEGTKKLINATKEEALLSKKMIHWVQLSSCGVYGPPPKNDPQIKRVITESSEESPCNEYERTKAESDKLVIYAADNKTMQYTIVRPSNVIGPAMTNKTIPNLICLISSGRFFFIGKKEAVATYVHVDDVVNALILVACNPKGKNEIFNISNDCNWHDLIIEIAVKLNVKVLPLRVPLSLILIPFNLFYFLTGGLIHIPKISVFAYRTNYLTTKIESYLGFNFTKPMPKSIQDLIVFRGDLEK